MSLNYFKVKYVFDPTFCVTLKNSPCISINVFKIPKIIRTIFQSHAKCMDKKKLNLKIIETH